MQEIKSSKLIVNKSKFFGHLYQINNIDEIKILINKHKKIYKKANHHCYTVILNGEEIVKNDGEVGHPGKVLLQILKKHQLNNHCIIVSRMFGGIKLGPSGVAKAFKNCANQLFNQ